jgi:AraC-like DNA-binding protein
LHEFWIPRGLPPFTVHFFRVRLAKDSRREFSTQTGNIVLHDAVALLPPMAALTSELRSRLPFTNTRLRAALALVCSQAFRLRAAPEAQNAGLSAAQRRHIAEFQRERVKARPTPADLARELRLSHDYFSRVFRRSFGMTPKEWLMRERIRHAAQWLASSVQNISEVAYEYGYPNVYLFSRQFKQVMGVGPKVWRGQSRP